jgi:hypothetical protein
VHTNYPRHAALLTRLATEADRVKDRLQYQLERTLDHSITDSGYRLLFIDFDLQFGKIFPKASGYGPEQPRMARMGIYRLNTSLSFRSNAVRFFSLGVYCGRHTLFRMLRTRRKSNPRKPKLSPHARFTVWLFEADFQPGSYGYRPKRTAHEAVLSASALADA